MATHDVPGSNPANRDKLSLGCWAEAPDGKSFVWVYSVEGDTVVYSMFDTSGDTPMEYRTALKIGDFEKLFTCSRNDIGTPVKIRGKAVAKELWTWHDKTPFPWDKIMSSFKEGAQVASLDAQLTAAQRIVNDLGGRWQTVQRDEAEAMAGSTQKEGAASTLAARFGKAINAFMGELRQ